jgi:hypothetical protein
VLGAATPLEPVGGLALVGDEAVEARAQVGAEARPFRVEAIEEALLEGESEEALREVLGVLLGRAPFQAQVLVDGLPVGRDQRFEGAPARVGVRAPRRPHDGPPREREGQRSSLVTAVTRH